MARIGFLGCGRTALARMEAMLGGGEIEAAAICDAKLDCIGEALKLAPDAVVVPDLNEMLELGLDAVAIATPPAQRPAQMVQALQAGAAVFVQAPATGSAAEMRAAVEAARTANRLLAVDLPYRFTEGMQRIREYVAGGEIGRVFAADLQFLAAEGPDRAWRYALSEGDGAASALGTHLVDLALWTLGFPRLERVRASLFGDGERLEPGERGEDFVLATLIIEGGAEIRLSCGWNRSVGRDAAIEAEFHGSQGGAAMRNVGYGAGDFRAELYRGAKIETLSASADPWAGRGAARFAARIAARERFDRQSEHLVEVSEALDRLYQRSDQPS